jgi:peptidoglycan/LPS O-acetylase OafA/YrhL
MTQLSAAVALAILSSGIFLLIGLLTGIWKYLAIMSSEKSRAPYYVDIAHRASLLYASASLILAALAYFSIWSAVVNFWAVLLNVIYFALAIGTYVIHGALKDTDNQLRRPHRLGKMSLPTLMIQGFMWSLIIAEVGGTVLLLAGAFKPLWSMIITIIA